MRRTKIVATIGPSSSDGRVLRAMIEAGMDVARLNFSHGKSSDHERKVRAIRRLSERIGRPIGIIGDLQGPKIRTGDLQDEPLELRRGSQLVITTRSIKGADGRISTTYRRLHQDVKPGDRILLDDGSMEVRVTGIEKQDIVCRVINGGLLGAHKGINLPGVSVSEPSLTRKDRKDVELAVRLGIDYLAMSFVRHPDDVARLKKHLKKIGADIPVIAKVEKPEALKNLEAIVGVADGVMVARGDLGVEMVPEKVPQIQKDIIRRCIRAGKPSITATQMLESMITQPRPTRAEASDVVNAIYDGTGAIMLSGETAVGNYPVQAVRMMARMAEEADTYMTQHPAERPRKLVRRREDMDSFSFEKAVGLAIEQTAQRLATRSIVCFTSSGFTAQQICSFRPDVPIIAATQNARILPRMSLYWGVQPIHVPTAKTVDSMITSIEDVLRRRRLARKGDSIIITAGYPLGVSGTTNMMQLVRVGQQGAPPGKGARGRKRGK